MDNECCLRFVTSKTKRKTKQIVYVQCEVCVLWCDAVVYMMEKRCRLYQDNAFCRACNPNGRQWMKSSAMKKKRRRTNNKEIKRNIKHIKWMMQRMAMTFTTNYNKTLVCTLFS